MPKVSIVLPCYNGEATIERAIKSIATQTYRDFETVFVDNKSDDRTLSIIEQYRQSANIRIVACDTAGIVPALNTGIYHSDSSFVARQDDDDYWYPTKLEKQMLHFEENPATSILGTRIRLLDEEGKAQDLGTYGRPVNYPVDDHTIRYMLILGQNPLCHPSVVMRREVPLVAGGYSQHFFLAEDMHLWLKAFPFFKFANLPEVLLDYTQTVREDYDPRVVKDLATFYYNLYKSQGIIEGDRPALVYDWERGVK